MVKDFIKRFEEKYIPLYKKYTHSYWNASISGEKSDWEEVAKSQLEITKLLRDRNDFEELKKIKSDSKNLEHLDKRQIDLLYNAYLPNQYDEKKLEEIIKLQTKIENEFTTFRAEVDGKIYTDNEIEEALKKETDSTKLETVWKASKMVGVRVASDVVKLVEMRNEQAAAAGFRNYHEMTLALSEQNPREIEKIFAEMNLLTEKAFEDSKEEIDSKLSERYNLPINELKPWHYQNRFFQEAPEIYSVNYNQFYENKDLVDLTQKYFHSIGLTIEDLINKSDLFEKPGKNQHAYCLDMDKAGDIRVLCNVKSNVDWMGTLLHEYGHAVYDKYIDEDLPFILKDPAHIFTTEAIAMLFGKFATHPEWIKDVVGIDESDLKGLEENAYKMIRLNQLVFSRWAVVMYNFEKNLYENSRQDLNKLWYTLAEKYQLLKISERENQPDWAAKIHIATSPCYYHNYLLGEILASQIYYYLVTKILGKKKFSNKNCFYNCPLVGEYLRENYFEYGISLKWDEFIVTALKESLNPKYYAEQYVSS